MAKIKNDMNREKKKKKDSKFKAKHYPCSYCNKTFSERAGRDHHLQLHSSERPFKCSVCPHTCKTKKYLAKHVRVVHNPPTSFKCHYCDKMFHFKSILDKHIVTHTNSKPHKCKECGKGFNSTYSLGSHVLIHKNLKPFKCKFCEYACRDSSTLRRHEERHQGIVKRYDCNICDKQFSKKQFLHYHVAEVHMKVNLKNIPCELCDRKFRTKKLLSTHIDIRHNRKFATTCEICGVKLSSKYNMNSHLLSHVDVRPHKCGFNGCDKRYKDRSSLKKHSIIHYPDKQYPCKTCGKKFTRKERLRKHKNQHIPKVKNVQCDYCGVRFYNKNYLTVHIRKKHTRRKKFICDLCDFESGNKPGLIKHIKGHNMKMSKSCPICSKTYKQENWLRMHLWQAHEAMETRGTPTFETDIKVEPVDMDATPEFELFEIEKEEILDELHSINNITNLEENMVTEAITEEYNDIENEKESFVLKKAFEKTTNVNDKYISKDTDNQLANSSNNNLYNDNIPKSSIRLSINDVADDNSHERKETSNFKEILAENKDDEKKSVGSDNNDIIDHCRVQDEYVDQNLETFKTLELEGSVLMEIDTETLLQHNIEQDNVTDSQTKVVKGSSKDKSLKHIKGRLKNGRTEKAKKKLVKRNTKRLNDVYKNPNNSKRKSLAYIKAELLKQKKVDNVGISSGSQTEMGDSDNDIEYSKAVLSEDITRCMVQRKKKNETETSFDDFFIEHIVERQEIPNNKILEIDKDCRSYAKNYINKLLEKKRNDNEVKLIEITRQQYNERIRKARKLRPEKVSIKYFDKNLSNGVIKTGKDTEEEDNPVNNVMDNLILEGSGVKDNDNENQDNMTIDNNLDDSDNTVQEKDLSDGNEVDIDRAAEENVKGRKLNLRSKTNKKYLDNDKLTNNCKIQNEEFRRIKLNSHQCYVCFKLFDSKEKLLDHCKDHFEVCNTTILKKCPLCDFATKLNIVQHMRVEHDVEMTIPSTRIIDKETDEGPRYCYKVNSETITNIDVIPSVKNLNKQAYIAIDKKNRELKDMGIAKTKLVKKGNEWIVERKTTKIDNVEEFILPEFDVDEILAIKIDSNDYLSRMKKLYRLAKKHKKRMLFPCESCEKICHTLSALKLHYRRHDPKSKPFKKKVWKHKMDDIIPTNRKVTDVEYGKKKYSRVVEIDRPVAIAVNDNRYKKPKPVVTKHKCDPELIKFYENNIKGGDIEFWQFLKIFNKMSRENVNDFEDLNERPEFGIHSNETTKNGLNCNIINDNGDQTVKNNKNSEKDIIRHKTKIVIKNRFKRIIRISKKDHLRRIGLKQLLREKIAEKNQIG